MFGYTGKILKVNLTHRTTMVETPGEDVYRMWFGGRGLTLYHLYRNMAAGVDPLGPQNDLVFATGGLTGFPVAGSGRSSVGAKSPLTGSLGSSEVGGFWGVELKKAGWDALIVEGASENPVYLYINGNDVEIRDAAHLWGKSTEDVQHLIRSELMEHVRISQIGPAGEKMVRYANIVNDLRNFAGRTGLGAVMGSKKLRAIAVKGDKLPPVSNIDALRAMTKGLVRVLKEEAPHPYSMMGTAGNLLRLNLLGGLPTRNFRSTAFEEAEAISADSLNKDYIVKRESCYACPIRCKPVVSLRDEHSISVVSPYGGPEYETLAALGSNCGVGDLNAVVRANAWCNAYGMDTISTGAAIAFAMEAFEAGTISASDAGNMDLRFGNAEAMIQMIHQIARREGLGGLLAEGVKHASAVIAGGSEHFAMHVKGNEIPMHEPRIKFGLGLGYVISPTGADHCHNMHDTAYTKSIKNLEPLGILKPLEANLLNSEKVRMFTYHTTWMHFLDSAVLCMFVPWGMNQLVEAVKAVTGWDTSLWELMKIGERVITLAQMYKTREGMGTDQDTLPKRFFQPLSDGPLKGGAMDEAVLREAKETYFGIMGWDDSGLPCKAKLAELGISWADPAKP